MKCGGGGRGLLWMCPPPQKKTPIMSLQYQQTNELELHRTPVLHLFCYSIVAKPVFCVYLVDSARPNPPILSSWRLRASCCEVGSSVSPRNSETEAFRDWALEECIVSLSALRLILSILLNAWDVGCYRRAIGSTLSKIRPIECNVKSRHLKKLTCTETLRQVFFCLMLHIPPPPHTHTVYVYSILIRTGKGRVLNQKED